MVIWMIAKNWNELH